MLSRRLALALLALAGVAAYDCPAATCDASPACQCASLSPPGGLSPAQTPQFIVLTNDDAVTARSLEAVRNVTGGLAQRNGCAVPATWFVCPLWRAAGWAPQRSDPGLVRRVYEQGDEVATHSMTHAWLPGRDEIVGARAWLNATAGLPLEAVRGFRAPYLATDAAQRSVLRQAGFLYDSSMTTQWGPGEASPNGSARVWPWTLDYGTPIACAGCAPGERQPGLWELPLWAVQDDGGAVLGWLDPGAGWGPDPPPDVDNFAAYRRELLRSYYQGNRAPVGIFLHAEMLARFPAHQPQLRAFLRWALAHDGVWAVTVSELLRWMKDPVPADRYEPPCPRPAAADAAAALQRGGGSIPGSAAGVS